MQDVRIYKELKNKINKFLKDNTFISSTVTTEEYKKKLLNELLGNKYNKNSILNEFEVIYCFNEVRVIFFKEDDKEHDKVKNNILLVKNNTPVIRIEYLEKKKGNSIYSEECYYTYDNNFLKDVFKIYTTTKDNYKKEGYSLFFDTCDINKILSKKFSIYYLNNEVFSVECNNKTNIVDSNSLTRFNSLFKEIKKARNIVENEVDLVLGFDEVKEYKIKSKNDK